MLPSKTNFPGRWEGENCYVGGFVDTDDHVFNCPGYQDILVGNELSLEMFWNVDFVNDMEKLLVAAKTMILIFEKMEHIQEMKGPSCGTNVVTA